jgi:hypothetical protein
VLEFKHRFTHPSVAVSLGVGLLCNLMIAPGDQFMPNIPTTSVTSDME